MFNQRLAYNVLCLGNAGIQCTVFGECWDTMYCVRGLAGPEPLYTVPRPIHVQVDCVHPLFALQLFILLS